MAARLETDEKLAFVDLMRAFPEVWDQRHADYKSRKARADSFVELAKQMSRKFAKTFDVDTLKESWKNLKTTYHMYRKGRRGGPIGGVKAEVEVEIAAETSANWPIHIARMMYLGGTDGDELQHSTSEPSNLMDTAAALQRLANKLTSEFRENEANETTAMSVQTTTSTVTTSHLPSAFNLPTDGSTESTFASCAFPIGTFGLDQQRSSSILTPIPVSASIQQPPTRRKRDRPESSASSASPSPASSTEPTSRPITTDVFLSLFQRQLQQKRPRSFVPPNEVETPSQESQTSNVPPQAVTQPSTSAFDPASTLGFVVEPFLLEAQQLYHKLEASWCPALSRLMKREIQRVTEKYEDAMLGVIAKNVELTNGLSHQS